MKEKIQQILSQMSLEEKASLCSGKDSWHLKDIKRLGIPTIMVTDGPHGLRKGIDGGGISTNVPATCFPTASATACSWNRSLMEEIGKAMGEECLQEDVSVILGPGVNIKRSPLCGRNFEYFSEDPYLTGEMSTGLINGIQSQGVGTSLKHFAVNNQETRRMTINAVVDERTLREIYLPGFEKAVKSSRPWTVMCAYNRLNGIYGSENNTLLNKILRDEWGFEGVLVTDWGACNDRVEGLIAGQDLEMPGSLGLNNARIVKAVKNKELDESILDKTVARLLELILKSDQNRKPGYKYSIPEHHALARRAAAESMVLLKNSEQILPLKTGQKIALIGAFAKNLRYQGAGSSFMNPTQLDNVCDEFSKLSVDFVYTEGYDPKTDIPDETLIQEACKKAQEADIAIVFAGLPNQYETESADRQHLRMPASHNRLITSVASVNPNMIVVLSNGAPVEMPWIDQVKGLLEAYLAGQAGAGAIVDILMGKVNPSGKLAETFPVKLEDTLSNKYFPSGPKTVEYRESIYVGYRYFDTAQKPVLFPFGYGLSYTTFTYSDLTVSSSSIQDNQDLTVKIKIKNSGQVAGSEIVQLYVRDIESGVFRPEKELKGFDKVFLQPGEEREITFNLNQRAFAYYNTQISNWHVETGQFEILVGASSRDIRASAIIKVNSTQPDAAIPQLKQKAPFYFNPAKNGMNVPDQSFRALYGKDLPSNQISSKEVYDLTSTLGDVKKTFAGRRLFDMTYQSVKKTLGIDGNDLTFNIMAQKMTEDLPLRNLVTLSEGQISSKTMEALILLINGQYKAGIFKLISGLFK